VRRAVTDDDDEDDDEGDVAVASGGGDGDSDAVCDGASTAAGRASGWREYTGPHTLGDAMLAAAIDAAVAEVTVPYVHVVDDNAVDALQGVDIGCAAGIRTDGVDVGGDVADLSDVPDADVPAASESDEDELDLSDI
jgi:hypothetical protein